MPVTSTRRNLTSSTTGLPPFSGSTYGSTLSTSSYRRSTALSPSRFLTTTSSSSSGTSGLGVGTSGSYRSLSSSSNYLSSRRSVGPFSSSSSTSNESPYVGGRYSSSSYKSTLGESGAIGSGSEQQRDRGSDLLGSRASLARSVALSGVDFYAKYSPANYIPNSELSRSRSLTDANRGQRAGQATALSSSSGSGSGTKSSSLLPKTSTNNNPSKSPSLSSIGSTRENRRSQYLGGASSDAEDENNNSRAGRGSLNSSSGSSSSLRRSGKPPKVALGGAGSALDTVDGDGGESKVTPANGAISGHAASPCAPALSDNNHNNVINNHRLSNNHVKRLRGDLLLNANRNNNPKRIVNGPETPPNVTRITIKHGAADGGARSRSNSTSTSQCTSNNRAIVHIFDGEERGQPLPRFNINQSSAPLVEDLRNNNSCSGSSRSINGQTKLGAELNGNSIAPNPNCRQPADEQAISGPQPIKVGHARTREAVAGSTMLLRAGTGGGFSNGTTTTTITQERRATPSKSSSAAGQAAPGKRDPEIFLRDECDLVRNELMQRKIAEHNQEQEEEAESAAASRSPPGGVVELNNNLNIARKGTAAATNPSKYYNIREGSAVISRHPDSGVKTVQVIVKGVPPEINNNNHKDSNSDNTQSNGTKSANMENGGCRSEFGGRAPQVLQNGAASGYKHSMNGRGSSPGSSSGHFEKMDTDPSDHRPMNGRDYNGYALTNGATPANGSLRDGGRGSAASTHSSSSSSSSSASSLDRTGSRSNFEDIKFIDSDDNNETLVALNGATHRISKLNRTIASTLDSLKAATPIVGGSPRQYNVTNGHHTLPYHSSSSMMMAHAAGGGGLGGRAVNGMGAAASDYTKKYSTLSNLPAKVGRMAGGLTNGGAAANRYMHEGKSYSKDALIMGLVPNEEEVNGGGGGVREHELLIKETADVDAMLTTSEPPNDKISGKSWEVNGTNGSSGVRTSSLRNALPPVSPVRTWERDRPRYRELLDAEPSTTSSSSSGKYDSYDKSSADSVDGLCGLRNIGNTCFMNSVIQCLSHTADLTKFLRGQRDPKCTTKDQRIFAEFVKLIKDMWSPNTRTVTPMELKSAFSSKHRMYSGCGQQDAQEFLRFFLDTLHSACNEGTKQDGLQLDDHLSDGKRADLMWDWYSKTENSVIKDLFVGQLRSTLRCTVCGNTSVTFDPFWDLSVPLPPSSSRCKLENCLELFIREEVLDGDEMPTCSKCKTRRKSTKSFTIQRFPKYLVIHLKRFSETRWSKLTNVVEFPIGEGDLNLAPYASNNTAGSPHYSLYGISNHMGSTAGGHYVALCKHARKWHEFNDNHVSESSESSLISSSAYLLFYERA